MISTSSQPLPSDNTIQPTIPKEKNPAKPIILDSAGIVPCSGAGLFLVHELLEGNPVLDWASKKADWFDPTVAREDEFFGKRKHGLDADQKRLEKRWR